MTRKDYRALAIAGAKVRLKELEREAAELRRTFGLPTPTRKYTRKADAAPTTKKKRRRLTPAERVAISKRMKAYWAERSKHGG